jgi:signal transduction histidine kinase
MTMKLNFRSTSGRVGSGVPRQRRRQRGVSPLEVVLGLSLLVVVAGAGVIGHYLERMVISNTLSKTTAVMGLFLDDLIAAEVQDLQVGERIPRDTIIALDERVSRAAERAQFVGLKVWSRDGEVLYSDDRALIGRRFGVAPQIDAAWDGGVMWSLSDLAGDQHAGLRSGWRELLEVFTPVHCLESGQTLAVAEFYFPLDDLSSTLRAKRIRTWVAVVAVALPIYGLLAVAVRRTTQTVRRQEGELEVRVEELDALLHQNLELSARVRSAAERGTALNERVRQRLSSDLHDGPLQELQFALLQLDRLVARHRECAVNVKECCEFDSRVADTRDAVTLAVDELRRVAKGLVGVDVDGVTVEEIVRRVVARHEERTAIPVGVELTELPEDASVAVKITLYRFLQEGLQNAYRHAGGVGQRVRMWMHGSMLCAQVSDDGPGIDADAVVDQTEGLGLRGLRDRVEILGGMLCVSSRSDGGTDLAACLPMDDFPPGGGGVSDDG